MQAAFQGTDGMAGHHHQDLGRVISVQQPRPHGSPSAHDPAQPCTGPAPPEALGTELQGDAEWVSLP